MRYSRLSNFNYIVNNWFKWDKKGTVLCFFKIPIAVLMPLTGSLLLKWMVRGIENKIEVSVFVTNLLLFFGAWVIFNVISIVIEKWEEVFQYRISSSYAIELIDKLMKIDYEVLEQYETRDKYQRCKKFAFEGSRSDGAWAAVRLIGLITSILGIVAYGALFANVNWVILLIVFITCALEFFTYHKTIEYGNVTANEMTKYELVFYYLFCQASDETVAKDIRLNNCEKWLIGHMREAANGYAATLARYTGKANSLTALQSFATLIRDLGITLILLLSIKNGSIELDEFVFYFTLITGFSEWLNGISGHISSLGRICVECDHYREFMELPEFSDCEEGEVLTGIESIDLKDVSYAYDGENYVLKNIDLSLSKGDSLAIVGENGAGKTTLIKIISGLYKPTQGEVLINNKPIGAYTRASVYSEITALFQDYILLPMGIEENIVAGDKRDAKRIAEALEKVELSEKKDSITDYSGGEVQRILLARAFYKNATLLLLDEPTAALDPLAEERLYVKYNEMSKDKISLFVSHRLNSTRFCNKIIFMREGCIVEEGTHKELLEAKGNYAKMYNIQGYYYMNQEEEALV